jgi:hypothetical protein
MGGCTNCKGKAGCDDRKGTMLASVDAALDRLYPTRTWGEAAEIYEGLGDDELEGLADEIAAELKAATFLQRGGDAEPCDYIWVLCMGRTPCVIQARDHGIAIPDEWKNQAIEELYMRVVISQRTRVAAVQQVAIEYVRGVVRERPRAGVYDAPLLHRMQKLVAILPAYDLLHVDFGEIAHAPQGFHAGMWADLYGGQPSIANYLFYPQPTTMVSTTEIG